VRLILEHFLQLWCSYLKKDVEGAQKVLSQLFKSLKKMLCRQIKESAQFLKTISER